MTKSTGKRPRYGSDLRTKMDFYSIPEPNTGCLIWTGARRLGDNSYGMMFWRGKYISAHILSWMEANGRRPLPGMNICHKCDFMPCIEPTHLYEGTPKDNMQDRERRGRGRQPKGEASGMSKLTEAQVVAIRADPRGKRPVAKDYGVTPTLVMLIRQRKAWKHVT